MRKLILLLCLGGFTLSTFAQTTHTVDDDGGGDFTTITAAIAAAAADDIIDITGGADNIHIESVTDGIEVNKSLTIQGQGQSTTFVQSAASEVKDGNGERVFQVTGATTSVTFQNMTIRYGNPAQHAGGIYFNQGTATGTATLTNVTITNNYIGSGAGGGVLVSGSGLTMTMTDCIFSNNTVGGNGNGGFIHQTGASSFTMTRCVVSGNTTSGNGGGVSLNENGSTNTLISCVISGNTGGTIGFANKNGGGIFVNNGTHIFKNCTISGNTSQYTGSGIYDISGSNSISLFHCTIASNTSSSTISSGAVYITGGTFNITNCIIADNTADDDFYILSTSVGNSSDADHSWVENCNSGIGGSCPSFVSTSGTLGSETSCNNANLKFLDPTGTPAAGIGKPNSEDGDIPTDDICGGARDASTPDAGSREIGALLPVSLVSFTVQATNKGHLLTWLTASELDNAGFEIERSRDAKEWTTLGFIEGHGTTAETHAYNFTDHQPLPGENYYRLKQVDFDEHFEYTHIVNIHNRGTNTSLSNVRVFPNPVQETLTIVEGEGQAILYNTLGQAVRQFTINNEQFSVGISDLVNGQYILYIQKANGTTVRQQFVKE